jgi:hypothetical protein
MPKNRSNTTKVVSNTVANSQYSKIYFLASRNRREALSDVEQRKLTATLEKHINLPIGTAGLAKDIIESTTKAFKAHRCALDSDYAFIRTA